MKTICIYHLRDLDGWMSAAIVKKYYDGAGYCSVCENPLPQHHAGSTGCCGGITTTSEPEFLGWDYGDEIPDLSGYNKVIMCDISFSKALMLYLFEKLDTNLIWIDHHISAIKDVLGDAAIIEHEDTTTLYNGLRRTDFAACELTWKYFFPNKKMPEIVRLLGRYDCFGHKGTDEEKAVLKFQYGARMIMFDYVSCYYQLIGQGLTIDAIYKKGTTIYDYLCTEAQQIYKRAFPVVFVEFIGDTAGDGVRQFLCVNQCRFNPVNFDIDYHKDGYDGFTCFHYENGMWTFSLYNDNGKVDCSVVAKQYGGGGHQGAAGFRINDLTKIINS